MSSPKRFAAALLSRFRKSMALQLFEELTFRYHRPAVRGTHFDFRLRYFLACGLCWRLTSLKIRHGFLCRWRSHRNSVIKILLFLPELCDRHQPIGRNSRHSRCSQGSKSQRCQVLAICNVYGSTLAREADAACFCVQVPEIGVCSTKAFTSQFVVLALFA